MVLWTQNATHPYAQIPWLAPSYLLDLPKNEVWGGTDSSWERLDEVGTDAVVGWLRNWFNFKLLVTAKDRYTRDLIAAAQRVRSATESPNSVATCDETFRPRTDIKAVTTKKKRNFRQTTMREEIIFAAIRGGKHGEAYCEALDLGKVKPSPNSKWRSWPGTYLKAYTANPPETRAAWRKKIWSERNKHKDKLVS